MCREDYYKNEQKDLQARLGFNVDVPRRLQVVKTLQKTLNGVGSLEKEVKRFIKSIEIYLLIVED